MIVITSAVIAGLSIKNLPTEAPKTTESMEELWIRFLTFTVICLDLFRLLTADIVEVSSIAIWASSCLLILAYICTATTWTDYSCRKSTFVDKRVGVYTTRLAVFQYAAIFVSFLDIFVRFLRM